MQRDPRTLQHAATTFCEPKVYNVDLILRITLQKALHSCHGSQAVRNEVVAADAAFLQREVERLSGELAEACSGAAETAALRAELAAATAAGSHLAEELAAAESAVRATQARGSGAAVMRVQHSSLPRNDPHKSSVLQALASNCGDARTGASWTSTSGSHHAHRACL